MRPRTSLFSSFLAHKAHTAKHPVGTTLRARLRSSVVTGKTAIIKLVVQIKKPNNLPISKNCSEISKWYSHNGK